MTTISKLWEYANHPGNIGIKVLLIGGGLKSYLLNDFDEPPSLVIQLESPDEERVFLMFRQPDLYDEDVKRYTKEKLTRALNAERLMSKGAKLEDLITSGIVSEDDLKFKERYFSDSYSLFQVRSALREQFKELLISKAETILNQSTERPNKSVVKSKTIWANILLLVLVYILQAELTPQEVGSIFAMLNIILRLITKQPIKEVMRQ